MEQMRNFTWAQDKIDALTGVEQDVRHEAQQVERRAGETRVQRRARERAEAKVAKRAKRAKA